MALVIIFLIIFIIYGAGWIWQSVSDIVRDIHRSNWDSRVYGQVASGRSVKRRLGGHDLEGLRNAYAKYAEEVRGELHDRISFESPKVSFLHKNSRALLSIYESSDEPPQFYTQLTYTMSPGWNMRLEVFPQRFQDMDVKYLNVDDIQIGDPVFDPRYVVKSNDPGFAKSFLNEPAKKAVEALRGLLGNDKILISINSSRLMVRKHSIISSYEDLISFSENAGAIYDRINALWQKASGIEILEEEPAIATGTTVCQVCGVEIAKDVMVFCRRCKTPHHTDCWEYNGGCSTYACGEKKYSRKY